MSYTTHEIRSIPTDPRFQDLTGREIDNWVVLGYLGSQRVDGRAKYWLCRCRCGREMPVLGESLRSGKSGSCGCNFSGKGIRHGLYYQYAAEHRSWRAMITRCTNPRQGNYCNYGGRGIRVCIRWRRSFAAFMEDMGPRPAGNYAIDRMNNDGDYEPTNCRWVTQAVNNQKRRNNRMLTRDGVTRSVTEWSNLVGIPATVISKRLRRGWTVDDALTIPMIVRRTAVHPQRRRIQTLSYDVSS